MPEPTNEWTIGVGHLVTRVRRRWRVLLGTAVVVLAATAAAGVLSPHQYTATASVAVSPIRNAATYATQPININTERAVLASREVAVLASQALHGSVSAAQLAAASTAAAPSGSEVLQVSVAAPRPADAAAWANAIASAYLQFRAQGALQSAQPSIEALQARIASVNPSNTSMLSDLRSQLVALQHSGEGTGRMIGRATAPTSPSSLGLQVYLIGGLIGGLLLGALLALIRDAVDPRVRLAERLGELTGRPGIALQDGDDAEAARWILRAIRRAAAGRGHGPTVVTVLSPSPSASEMAVASIARFASTAGIPVRTVQGEEVPAHGLRGPDRASLGAEGADLVVIDAGLVAGARRAALVDLAGAVLLVAGGETRVRELKAILDTLDGPQLTALVPVYTTSSEKRRPSAAPAASAALVTQP